MNIPSLFKEIFSKFGFWDQKSDFLEDLKWPDTIKYIEKWTESEYKDNQKPFSRIIFTKFWEELRKNKKLNNILLLMLENGVHQYDWDWFSIKRMTEDTLQMDEDERHKWEAHSDSFKISFTRDGVPVNLFLKLNNSDYSFSSDFDKFLWHNEFLALEEVKKRIKELKLKNVDVVSCHFWFTHIKKLWNRNIINSWIVYDYMNLPTVLKAYQSWKISYLDYNKYSKLLSTINTDKIRDIRDWNAFLDIENRKLYVFDAVLLS